MYPPPPPLQRIRNFRRAWLEGSVINCYYSRRIPKGNYFFILFPFVY